MLKDFKDQPFTFKFDESTTSQVKNKYDAYVQFWPSLHQQIVSRYWWSVFVGYCDSEKVLNHFFQSGKEIGGDRLPLHIGMDGPNVNLEVQEGFLSVLRGTSYSRDTEHLNLKKWVNSCNLTNDGRQHYPF